MPLHQAAHRRAVRCECCLQIGAAAVHTAICAADQRLNDDREVGAAERWHGALIGLQEPRPKNMSTLEFRPEAQRFPIRALVRWAC